MKSFLQKNSKLPNLIKLFNPFSLEFTEADKGNPKIFTKSEKMFLKSEKIFQIVMFFGNHRRKLYQI